MNEGRAEGRSSPLQTKMNQVHICIFVDVMTMAVSAHILGARLCPFWGEDHSLMPHEPTPKLFMVKHHQRCVLTWPRDVYIRGFRVK